MSNYTIKNTTANTVVTLSPGQHTGTTFPIEMTGFGYSLYGPIMWSNDYKLMENFAGPTPPTPVNGMFWYNTTAKNMNFYNTDGWQTLATTANTPMIAFDMETLASNVDLSVTQDNIIFQAPNLGRKYLPTAIMVQPTINPTYTVPPTFNLYSSSNEDVLENITVMNMTLNSHAFYNISGVTKTLTGSDNLKLKVVSPANNVFRVKVTVFGMIV